MRRIIPSSFDGKICEIPGIYVDNFENPLEDGARAYFLSHFHADHTVGLDTNELLEKLKKEKRVFIYATKLTAAIIIYENEALEDYVKILNLGSQLITIPNDSEKNYPEIILNVKLIPAGHCLGSTMFFFETITVKVLYTGDFRIRSNDLPKYAAFHDKDGQVIKLDTLYVDTTFIEKHENFPKRSDSTEEVIALLKGFLESNQEQCVIIETSASYGYEYVFNQIYKLLGMKVYVSNQKWNFYRTIQHLVPGVTNNANEARIFLNKPTSKFFSLPPKRVKFSALIWNTWNDEQSSIKDDGKLIRVCFSTHCSKSELINFVEYLNPVKVVGFPHHFEAQFSPDKATTDEKFVQTPKKTPRKRPHFSNREKNEKVDEAVLRKIFG